MSGAARARGVAAAAPELALAAVVVGVVALIVAPVAPPVIDVLLAASLGLAAAMLVASLGARAPRRLAAFPALVLISVLVRLGLLVAATRGILGDGDGGRIVAAFGDRVAGGHVVTGLVLFAAIAIFQLVVVARGAERVAEVAARFALDAMPGKQLAIDADLRAGAIDGAEAARRRAALEGEAQLYGAMDGAMKFVRGDAIAALLVVVLAGIAGVALGAGGRGLGVADAARAYAVPAIGAGLAVQLPALLVAVAAALLVTRAAGDADAGVEVAAAPLVEPRALGAAAALLAALAAIPGFPAIPLLALAAAAAGVAVWRARRTRAAAPRGGLAVAAAEVRTAPPPPVEVRLGAALAAAPPAALAAALDEARQAIHDRLGVRVPPIAAGAGAGLDPDELALALDGVEVAYERVAGGGADAVAAVAGRALARVAHELVTLDAVAARLDEVAVTRPAAVREVVPRLAPLPVVTAVVRQLVREQVPVRDLAAVLGAIAAQPAPAAGFGAADVDALAEKVRAALPRWITAAHAPRGELAAWTIDGMIEDALRGAVVTRDGAPVLALEPELARDIVAAARASLPVGPSVVLASGDVRRHLRELLEPELPDVAVVAPHELAAGITVRAAGRIAV